LGLITSTIGCVGGSIGAIDIVEAGFDQIVRDFTIATCNEQHAQEIIAAVRALPAVELSFFRPRVPSSYRGKD